MKKHLKSVLTLFVICAIVSVALAVVNGITAPIILEKQQAAASGALAEVMPNGGTFTKIELPGNLPASIKEVHEASNGGYVFQVSFDGYKTGNVAMIGVDADGKVTGTKCITIVDKGGQNGKDSASIIPEFDSSGHYTGADIKTISSIDTVAGVTMSTEAYRGAVKDALDAAIILGGGSVDRRDPAQILNDNLNAVLGTEGVKFEKHFFCEVVEGVDDIYVAENNAGYVVVIGETYVGVNADGSVIGEANEVAAKAIATIKATTFENIDLTKFEGIPGRVKSAKVTNDGVYVIEVEGAGFHIIGDEEYIMDGESVINIRISISADNKIIDCYTIDQNESKGYGAACGKEEFYGQFAGKEEANYSEIIIAGSTYTTKGYHKAIENAYLAITIIRGGTN